MEQLGFLLGLTCAGKGRGGRPWESSESKPACLQTGVLEHRQDHLEKHPHH